MYAAAVRFFTDAFADQPNLPNDPTNQHRYNAACSAALAGCGQGEDAKKLDAAQRTELRKQAIEWLRADLTAHQASPTKDPTLRLQTIRDADDLKIPFTSGILVGIGETEQDRIEALEALAGFDHLQEVILQNFVPHRRYYGEEPADIATGAAEAFWRTGLHDGPVHGAPSWATPVGIEDMKRLIAEMRRLMPEVGIQVPPNLSDWWPELVAAGYQRASTITTSPQAALRRKNSTLDSSGRNWVLNSRATSCARCSATVSA